MKRFAMITHFTGLDSRENFIYYPFFSVVLKFIPLIWIKRLIPRLPPHVVISARNVTSYAGSVTEGHAIMCPLLPEQFYYFNEATILNKIIKCCAKAKLLKADIIGLAAFTSVIGNEGEAISKNVDVAVTSGNTYTAFLAVDSVLKAINILGFNTNNAKLVVLGATGDIGSICTKILSRIFTRIVLVARSRDKLDKLVVSLSSKKDVRIERNPSKAISDGDVILSVTSSAIPLFDVAILKPGSIFCDVSIPPAIPKKINNFRNDVLIFDGGKAKLPNFESIIGEKWHSLFPDGIVFGCLAEAMLLALEEKIENYSIGRGSITEDKIHEIESIALKHGFKTSPFYFGNYAYSEEDLQNIKSIYLKNSKI
ncbi:MAG TPA: hypothetical protein PL155_09315 [Candidatus Omnitrophota bacterium]|nr:hypothetical protein [Candidatus Omnitrophota bacterium]HPD85626.1 hypothetical protein [Candidatus Omnitrophota bacterium]HRZ04469.1 hypothetical protein [Candidatus Omnitrophota bacterium]